MFYSKKSLMLITTAFKPQMDKQLKWRKHIVLP